MNRIPIYLCLISALLLLRADETSGQETTTIDVSNPFVGTWALNLDKSSNPIPLKSDIFKIEAQDNGLKFTLDRLFNNGISRHLEYSPRYDGKLYPVIGGNPDVTTSLRRINTNSFELVNKNRIGQEMNSFVMVISEDGMTSTATIKGKNAQGQEVTFIFVYDKQEG